jgi:hypothetical protein
MQAWKPSSREGSDKIAIVATSVEEQPKNTAPIVEWDFSLHVLSFLLALH